MQRFLLLILGILPAWGFSLGVLCHNYVANQAAVQISAENPTVAAFLRKYHNAYVVGSDYPDTGFVGQHDYGEIAHWPNFVDPFVALIRAKYANATGTALEHRNRLIAFLMGVGTHIKSDIVSHWTYYVWVAKQDFHASGRDAEVGGKIYEKAHSLMDPGSDAYVTVRKGIYNHPVHWWVPVSDLVTVYGKMGHQISRETIIDANAEYYVLTGLDEDLIAYPEYLYDALYKAPWAMAHFDDRDAKLGALPEMERQSGLYALDIYQRATAHQARAAQALVPMLDMQPLHDNPIKQSLLGLIDHAVKVGWLTVTPKTDAFGAITFDPKSIRFNSALAKAQFNAALKTLLQKLVDQLSHQG